MIAPIGTLGFKRWIRSKSLGKKKKKKKGDASWLMSRLYQTCHNNPQRDRLGSSRLVAVCKIMRWAKAGCMALAPAQGKKSLFWQVTTAEKPFRRRTRRRWPVALGKRAKLESPPRNMHIVACMTQKERRKTTTGNQASIRLSLCPSYVVNQAGLNRFPE